MSTFDIESDLAAVFELLPGAEPAESAGVEPVEPAVATAAGEPAEPPIAPAESVFVSPFAAPPVTAAVVTVLPPPVVVMIAAVPPKLAGPQLPSLPVARPRTAPPADPETPSVRPAALVSATQPRPAPSGNRVVRAGISMLLVAIVGVGGRIALKEFRTDDPSAPSALPAAVRTPAPTEWDPRVMEMVTFVQSTRGLTFKHPLLVDFLAEDEFVALFDRPTASAADAAEIAQYSAVFDAAGLAVDYDPSAGGAQLAAATTLGFYSLDDDRVYVRGAELTPAVKTVLAHELTHALQAQHFDLDTTESNDLEVRSIVEADAMRIEDAYLASLETNEAFSADVDTSADSTAVADLSAVPWAVVVQQYAPYQLGPRLVGQAFAAGGNAAVDDLIRNPPSEERLVSPWLDAASTTDLTIDVVAPGGATVIESPRQLSMLDTLVMLDAWLPWTQTRQARVGWSGGGYVSYARADGVVCFAAAASFDVDPDPFARAIAAWAAASGSSSAPVVDGLEVSFEACDRGEGALAPPEPVLDPLFELSIESDIVGLAGDAPTPDVLGAALCYANRMIDDPALAPLLHEGDSTEQETLALDYLKGVNSEICGFSLSLQPG